MKITKLIFLLFFLPVIISVIPPQAYCDGFTQENLPAVSVGNRKVSLFVKINPPVITSQNNQDRYILFRFFDANTNQTLQHTTFLLEIAAHNQLLARGVFHSHSGTLTLKIRPSDDPAKWAIYSVKEPFLDEYMNLPQSNGTINVVAPILGQGGLYHLYVILITMDSDQNFFKPQDSPKFDAFLSVGDVSSHDMTFNGNTFNSTVISYYDKINDDFAFDPSILQISYSMPFDWNVTRIASQPIFVHEEIHIPKSFKEFTDTPTYTASVNGYPITGRRIIVDPYTQGDTVIAHILLSKVDIEKMAGQVPNGPNTMSFTLAPAKPNVVTSTSALTDFGGWGIKLGWNPTGLTANSKNDLKLNFFDAFTEQQVAGDVNYDLKILDNNGTPVLSLVNLTAKNGTDIQSINLPGNGIYQVEINVKSIVNYGLPDTSRIGVARGNLVIPSTVTQEVPVPEFGPLVEAVIMLSIIGTIIINRKFLLSF